MIYVTYDPEQTDPVVIRIPNTLRYGHEQAEEYTLIIGNKVTDNTLSFTFNTYVVHPYYEGDIEITTDIPDGEYQYKLFADDQMVECGLISINMENNNEDDVVYDG